MKHRVSTPEQKKNVLDQLYQVWLKNDDLRLGQLLLWVSSDNDLFYIEDNDLIDLLTKMQ